MNTINVNISSETAKRLLSDIEAELLELRKKTSAKEEEFNDLKRAMNGVASEPVRSLPLSVEKNASSGRARKGESDKVVRAFFESHRGTFWSRVQVADKTGVSVSSARRSIKRLEAAGVVDGVEGHWGVRA